MDASPSTFDNILSRQQSIAVVVVGLLLFLCAVLFLPVNFFLHVCTIDWCHSDATFLFDIKRMWLGTLFVSLVLLCTYIVCSL